jgi:hypothetical protein
MSHDADIYRRELDLIFQDMSDRESLASKSELFDQLTGHGIDVAEVRRILRKAGRQKGKSKDQLEMWVEGALARLGRVLNAAD